MSDERVTVRSARVEELPAVMAILDAAMLEVDAESVRVRVPAEVLVATAGERVVGALVLDGDEVVAVAVRPGRRGQGIGVALVEAALDRRGRLTAEFDADVRPFYAALGFDVERASDGRLRGVLE